MSQGSSVLARLEELQGFMAKKGKKADGSDAGGPEQVPTGIDDLDEILYGGIPAGSAVMVSGASGSGKTTTVMELACRAAAAGEPAVVYLTSETPERAALNHEPFEFFNRKLIEDGKLLLLDMDETYKQLGIAHVDTGLSQEDGHKLLDAIERAVDDAGAKRLVIDSIASVMATFEDENRVRSFLKDMVRRFSDKGVLMFLTAEIPPDSVRYSCMGFEDGLVDGVILLSNIESRGDLLRGLQIIKMRGSEHSRSAYVMDLTQYGIILVPVLKSYTKGGAE